MGLLLDTFSLTLDHIRRRREERKASSLLEEALSVLNAVSAPHWSGSSVDGVPDMIRDLARDRDDYRRMAEAYRQDLALLEARQREAVRDEAWHEAGILAHDEGEL